MKARELLLGVLSASIGMVVFGLSLEVFFRFLPVYSGLSAAAVNAANPALHFVPNGAFTYSRGWRLQGVNRGRVNNFGFINQNDYRPEAVPPLVAVVGDSYVEALMIDDAATFHKRLATAAGNGARVYSFGISGAPLSQYLAWSEWIRATFRPEVIVIVVVGNDFDESLLRYKRTKGMHYFDDSTDQLPLVRVDYEPSQLPFRRSALYRYLLHNLGVLETLKRGLSASVATKYIGNVRASADADRIRRSQAAVIAFLDRLPAAAGLPVRDIVFVLDGMRPSLYSRDTLAMAAHSYWSDMRRYFAGQATARGYEVIDMQPLFIRHHELTGAVFEFPDDGHWNEEAHAMVAEAIRRSATFQRIHAR